MDIKKIAVVITGLIMSGSAVSAEVYNQNGNKLDFYGKVKAQHYFSDDKNQDGDQTYVRIGIKGETQINDLMTGYAQWEYQFQGNNDEGTGATGGDKTRMAFAGLNFSEFGSVDYGRNYGVAYDISSWTDMLPEFGADTSTQTDVFMTGRATGVATYRNRDFFGLVDGLNFALQYQGKADDSDRSVQKQHGDGFGISASYEYAGISAGASYTASDRSNEQVEKGKTSALYASGDKAELWNVGLKYDANNIYLAATYAETRNMTSFGDDYIAEKTQNYEVVAQYQFDFGLRPSIAYLKSKGKDFRSYGDQDLVEYVDVGTYYYFNKNMSAYVDYKINLLDDNNFTRTANISTDNIVGVGLTYLF
ncbi:porin OmpC [Klebsiella indica]|uniref:Porin OmpC n=1 Tax=Klebsiella indica TaxID=2582917 RepID=A0A5R9LGJ5_9ENTR|nr:MULTISPECIES: porin OmpC [Klebsiella]TLV15651.1 porin OmpC [Klebsiella indica]